MQILFGSRQVGKTTLIGQVLEEVNQPYHYASADIPTLEHHHWITEQWNIARDKEKGAKEGTILVLDEVQKISHWSDTVKQLWDEDTRNKTNLKVVLLGSSSLLMQRGLTESLAGRFEKIPITHWNFNEMQEAFGFDLDQFVYFGGYPGSAGIIEDELRWKRYITDSIIETTISKDILLHNRIDKPALLRRLFFLGCDYSSQIMSYQKMIGQLQDAGNTTTLAHYLDLLSSVSMLVGLPKYSGNERRKRGSSPKFQVFNTALMSAVYGRNFNETRPQQDFWGRRVESAVGAHLINQGILEGVEVYYWREGIREVDFVLKKDQTIVAIEVKSGRKREVLSGVNDFTEKFKPKRTLLIGHQGVSLAEFLSKPLSSWFD